MEKFLRRKNSGFTLLEVIIVVTVLAILAAIASGIYSNLGKNTELNSVAETISFDLRRAQSRAMVGEGGFKWGIHFVNGATDYYEAFSTPTDYSDAGKVVVATTTLSNGITFSSPAAGFSTDVIFNKITGTTTASSIVIANQNYTKTINTSVLGNNSVQ